MDKLTRSVLLLAMAAAAVSAAVPSTDADAIRAASGFMPPGETITRLSAFTDGAERYFYAEGSGNTTVFLDSDRVIIADETKIRALAKAISAKTRVSAEDAGVLSQEAGIVAGAVAACKAAYYDFSTGKSLCLDDSYRKYRCDFLWGMGFWQNVLPFDIIKAKGAIEGGLKTMNESLGNLSAGLEKLSAGEDYLDQVYADFSQFNAAYLNFSEWHAKMLTQPSFKKDGGLSHCSIPQGDVNALASSLGAAAPLDAGTVAQKAIASISSASDTGMPKILGSQASASLGAYSEDYYKFRDAFTAIRQLNPTFASRDQYDLQDAMNSISAAEDSETAGILKKAFDAKLAQATKRLEDGNASLGSYSKAAAAMKAAKAAIEETSQKNGEFDDSISGLRREYLDLDITFGLAEIDFKANGKAQKEVFESIAANATGLSGKSNAAGTAGQQGIDYTLVIGGVLLLAMAGGAIYWYRKRSEERW